MKPHWNLALLGCISVLAACLFIGCGGGDSEASDSLAGVDLDEATLAHCLKSSGAQFARASDELDFFSTAEDEETASKFGFRFDRSAQLFVELWEDGDDPREWLMWSAQRFDEDMSPEQIVSSDSPGSYVAFMLNPSRHERQAAKACTTLASQKRREAKDRQVS